MIASRGTPAARLRAPAERRVETQARGHLRSLGERAGVMNVLEAISRLKQICNYCPDSGRSAKQDDLSGVERDAVVRRFDADHDRRALVLSLRAGGQGLNLQTASYVVHFDRWWNPAVEDQATDRSHRSGQRHPVTVYEYVCGGTIEERIEQILDEKRALFRSLVDGISIDLTRALSPAELFGLLGLPVPRRLAGDAAQADPIAWARGLLEAAGWVVRERPADATSPTALKAMRTDEVGRSTGSLGCPGRRGRRRLPRRPRETPARRRRRPRSAGRPRQALRATAVERRAQRDRALADVGGRRGGRPQGSALGHLPPGRQFRC